MPSIVTDARQCRVCGHFNAAGVSECSACGEDMAAKARPSGYPRTLFAVTLSVGGPAFALVAYGLLLVFGDLDKAADGEAQWAGLLIAFAAPIAGSLFLRWHVAVRLCVGLLLGCGGALFFICASFPIWLRYGPGWMD